MGCFSFICKECRTPINSDSISGEQVTLFLLEEGYVIEAMTGAYDSYGRVFEPEYDASIEWRIPWDEVCELMFRKDHRNGIAAIHKACQTHAISLPMTRSEDDPEQGWGELREEYM